MRIREYLVESSLSRVYKHNENHDCGALTAFRKYKGCGETEELYTKKENMQRNKSLLSKLISKGYSVISLKGKYPEGGTTTTEESFFVVDIEDTGNLEKDLLKLGEEFEQDSILFIPKGAVSGETKAYLIGTNKCDNNWLGYHKKEVFGKGGRFGVDSKIYTSYVNGRPFIFEEVGSKININNGMTYILIERYANKHWSEINID